MSNYTLQKILSKEERKKLDEYSDLVSHLLFYRGIKTNKDANEFINLDFEKGTHNPFLFKDMDKAVGRILKAIKSDEKITIFSDYDADGIPAAVVMNDFFEKVGYKNFDVYIPHRNIEGFGLNKKAIKKLSENGTNLIITLDCGISDVEQVKYSNELNLDVIITDHHEAHKIVPEAFAIINPKQKDCKYPEKMLCGSGVAFKLVQALIEKGDFDLVEGWEKWLLDMVGIATLSDMVPLTGENRVFASFGLQVLKKTRRKGLHRLFNDVKLNQNIITETDVVFSITPRINAASRMGEPKIAFKMLKTTDENEAAKMVNYLNTINDERKGHVAAMVKQIKDSINKKYVNSKPKVIVEGNTNWRPSLLGLAATKIMEEYNAPVLLWGRGEGSDLKGSGRSPKNVDLIKLMGGVSDKVIEAYGGHKNAGGFVVSLNGVDSLEMSLQESFKKMGVDVMDIGIEVDYQLPLNDVNSKLLDELKMLAPYGADNKKPLFLFTGVEVSDKRFFGKDEAHVEFTFKDESGIQSAIMFYPPEEIKKIKEETKIDLIGAVEYDSFRREARLRIENIFKL